MSSFRSDPLLGIARGLLIFILVVLVVAMTALGIALGAVIVMYPTVLAKLAENGVPPIQGYWAALGMILLGGVMVAIGYRFTDLLRRIVDSVGEGDPFIPVNAVRLNHMAWLTIALQAVAIPLGALGFWIGQIADKADVDVEFDVDFNAIMLAIVLFILARVFRRGAEMREELEGTV